MEYFLILFQQPVDFGVEVRAKLMERQGNVQEQALTCTPGMLPISAKEIIPTGCTLQKGDKHAPVLAKV